jgi:type IV pilus assembly protein PilW
MNARYIRNRQRGAGVVEVMVAMTISLVVTAAMITMMSNSLGSTARIIKMTKLSDDLRITMQMMSRDIRRSSYNANAVFCYANSNCGTDGAGVTLAGDVSIWNNDALVTDGTAGNCVTFLLDRDHDGDSTENDAGGFRRAVSGGVGVLEMWIGGAEPACDVDSDDWVAITNPGNMDITAFEVDSGQSFEAEVYNDGAGNTLSQRVRRIHMNLAGRLVMDNTITRQLEETINIRNDLLL